MKQLRHFRLMISCLKGDLDKNNALTMSEAIMKEALISIMRQEQEALGGPHR